MKQKENIFEELNKMRNLIRTKPGVVISEQEFNEDTTTGLGYNDTFINKNTASNDKNNARLQNIANMQKTVDSQGIIKNPASKFNNTRWADYIAKFGVKQDEINQAKELTKTQKVAADNTQKRLQNIANIARLVNADGMIVNPSSQFNNTPWADYIKRFGVTQDEINKANELNKKVTPAPASSRQRRQSTQSSVNDRFTKTAESLGVKGGKMDLQTLQTMIKTLEGGNTSTPTQGTPDLAQLTAAINQLNQ